MSSLSNVSENKQQKSKSFASYAILDFETSNLPSEHVLNKVGITELSMYGVAVGDLENFKTDKESKIPLPPRVLHKLTLMINPMLAIAPMAESITGLNNFMLEEESKFNKNAANTLLGFLKHLKQPVCLVAHNGWQFDFPILKYVMERINMNLPSDFYCLDSIRAFHDIDVCRLQQEINDSTESTESTESMKSTETTESDECVLRSVLKAEKDFDARARNEMTPKRPILNSGNRDVQKKRKLSCDADSDNEGVKVDVENRFPKSRRKLNFGESIMDGRTKVSFATAPGKRWFPPKGVYKLPIVYKRVFEKEAQQSHYAEADVSSLLKLMQHYGTDFVDYSNLHAISIEEIPTLGTRNYL